MGATQIEVQSFVDKFSHLSSLGYNANLEFKSYQGDISVTFQANLGMFNQLPQPLTHILSQHQVKPSIVRRRIRRKHARQDNICVEENGHYATHEGDEDKDEVNEENTELTNGTRILCNKDFMATPDPHHDYDKSTTADVDITTGDLASSEPIPVPNSIARSDDQIDSLNRCCPHICRSGSPPPDRSKCCYHRCRPTWTLEQRIRNYGSGN